MHLLWTSPSFVIDTLLDYSTTNSAGAINLGAKIKIQVQICTNCNFLLSTWVSSAATHTLNACDYRCLQFRNCHQVVFSRLLNGPYGNASGEWGKSNEAPRSNLSMGIIQKLLCTNKPTVRPSVTLIHCFTRVCKLKPRFQVCAVIIKFHARNKASEEKHNEQFWCTTLGTLFMKVEVRRKAGTIAVRSTPSASTWVSCAVSIWVRLVYLLTLWNLTNRLFLWIAVLVREANSGGLTPNSPCGGQLSTGAPLL